MFYFGFESDGAHSQQQYDDNVTIKQAFGLSNQSHEPAPSGGVPCNFLPWVHATQLLQYIIFCPTKRTMWELLFTHYVHRTV